MKPQCAGVRKTDGQPCRGTPLPNSEDGRFCAAHDPAELELVEYRRKVAELKEQYRAEQQKLLELHRDHEKLMQAMEPETYLKVASLALAEAQSATPRADLVAAFTALAAELRLGRKLLGEAKEAQGDLVEGPTIHGGRWTTRV